MKVFKKSGKPFKSGLYTNTVSEIIEHPNLKAIGKHGLAYTFLEDDSYVDIRSCEKVLENDELDEQVKNDFQKFYQLTLKNQNEEK